MIKQVLVVNLKSNMSLGRLAAQIAHSSQLAFGIPAVRELVLANPAECSPCTKVVLKGWGDEHLQELYDQAVLLGVPAALMAEDGFKTALAIGPWSKNQVDKVTSGLALR